MHQKKSRPLYCWRSGWLLLLVTLCGCKSLSVPSLGSLSSTKPVPPEILARVGPASEDRAERIDELGSKAARGTVAEQQQISELLTREIQTEPDPHLRRSIIDAISNCQTPTATAVMRAGLNDEDLDVRIACCDAWARRGGPEAVAALSQTLGSNAELDVRIAAARALGEIKQPGVVEALSVALEPTQDPALQHRAVQSLRQVTDLSYGNDVVAWRNYTAQLAAQRRTGGPAAASPTNKSLIGRAFSLWR